MKPDLLHKSAIPHEGATGLDHSPNDKTAAPGSKKMYLSPKKYKKFFVY
jgi:hypothetical protein